MILVSSSASESGKDGDGESGTAGPVPSPKQVNGNRDEHLIMVIRDSFYTCSVLIDMVQKVGIWSKSKKWHLVKKQP